MDGYFLCLYVNNIYRSIIHRSLWQDVRCRDTLIITYTCDGCKHDKPGPIILDNTHTLSLDSMGARRGGGGVGGKSKRTPHSSGK